MRQGKLKAAAMAYKRAIELNPELARYAHFVAAGLQKNTAIAPTEYIVNLF